MRIDATAGLVLEGQLQLLRAVSRYDLSGLERSLGIDNRRVGVSIQNLHRPPVEMIAESDEYERLGPFLND